LTSTRNDDARFPLLDTPSNGHMAACFFALLRGVDLQSRLDAADVAARWTDMTRVSRPGAPVFAVRRSDLVPTPSYNRHFLGAVPKAYSGDQLH
jgi:hypothetical protein